MLIISILVLTILLIVGSVVFYRSRYPRHVFLWKNKNPYQCDKNKLWGNAPVECCFFNEFLPRFKLRTIDNSFKKIDVLVYCSNHHTASEVRKVINKTRPRLLIQVSDEQGDKPEHNDLAMYVPHMWRQYAHHHYPQHDNIRIIPLGYHCWESRAADPIPVLERKWLWSFIGSPKGEREYHFDHLSSVIPQFFCGTTDGSNNNEIFANSVFVFCPKGNHVFETFRQYNASRHGCIPVFVTDKTQFEQQFSYLEQRRPPWIRCDSIEEAAETMKNLLKEKDRLETLSKGNLDWWAREIDDLKHAFNSIKH